VGEYILPFSVKLYTGNRSVVVTGKNSQEGEIGEGGNFENLAKIYTPWNNV